MLCGPRGFGRGGCRRAGKCGLVGKEGGRGGEGYLLVVRDGHCCGRDASGCCGVLGRLVRGTKMNGEGSLQRRGSG